MVTDFTPHLAEVKQLLTDGV